MKLILPVRCHHNPNQLPNTGGHIQICALPVMVRLIDYMHVLITCEEKLELISYTPTN